MLADPPHDKNRSPRRVAKSVLSAIRPSEPDATGYSVELTSSSLKDESTTKSADSPEQSFSLAFARRQSA